MHKFNLAVIEKPTEGTANVYTRGDLTNQAPFMSGEGKCTYLCGNCEHVLLHKVGFEIVKQIVLNCPKCSSYNQT